MLFNFVTKKKRKRNDRQFNLFYLLAKYVDAAAAVSSVYKNDFSTRLKMIFIISSLNY